MGSHFFWIDRLRGMLGVETQAFTDCCRSLHPHKQQRQQLERYRFSGIRIPWIALPSRRGAYIAFNGQG